MYTYQNLIKRWKKFLTLWQVVGDLFLFLYPFWGSQIVNYEFFAEYKIDFCHIFWSIVTLVYFGYLIMRIHTIVLISSDQMDAYRTQFMEQVSDVALNKYNMLCKNAYHNPSTDNVLLYDAHEVINDVLNHLKQLVSKITGISMSNISVNFIYKYMGEDEYWQTIDGSSSCSIGSLDNLVKNEDTVYHHLYSQNREYVFANDKNDNHLRCYRPSMRDGEDKSKWGSIYCKRIPCMMQQDRIVDGIIAISTYNEKFTESKRKKVIQQTEGLINEAVTNFENLIRIEMVSLYMRHNLIKDRQIEALKVLGVNNPEELSEKQRIEKVNMMIPKFKKDFNHMMRMNNLPCYFEHDQVIDNKTASAIGYEMKNNHMREKIVRDNSEEDIQKHI